jgi:hypothetical protein
MAAVTYRCPDSPDECPESSSPGYCTRHPMSMLEAVRRPGTARPAREPAESPVIPARDEIAVELLGRSIPVPVAGLKIGREIGPLSGIPGMSELTQVSRLHAELYWLGGVLYVRDCESTNGTFLDGERVVTPRRLAPGQMLRLALDVEVRVVPVEYDEFGFPR